MIIKSTPNEINAVIVLDVNDNDFSIEYTYDDTSITYDTLMPMEEISPKIEDLRKQGLKGFVVNKKLSSFKIPY